MCYLLVMNHEVTPVGDCTFDTLHEAILAAWENGGDCQIQYGEFTGETIVLMVIPPKN